MDSGLTKKQLEQINELTLEQLEDLLMSDIPAYQQLLIGCRTNEPKLVIKALERGADINRRDHESWTPLMHAAYFDSADVLPILIDNEAKVHIRDDEGESVLKIIEYSDEGKVIEPLKEKMEKIRLKHTGLFIEALKELFIEQKKPSSERDDTKIALNLLDLGWGWWVREEQPDKVEKYFRRAFEYSPRLAAFPLALWLAATNKRNQAYNLLNEIVSRKWGMISRNQLDENEAFFTLKKDKERWSKLLRRWPAKGDLDEIDLDEK